MCQNLNETTFFVFRNQTLIGRTTIDEPKPKRDAISKMKFATVVGNDDESQWVPRNSPFTFSLLFLVTYLFGWCFGLLAASRVDMVFPCVLLFLCVALLSEHLALMCLLVARFLLNCAVPQKPTTREFDKTIWPSGN